MQANKSKIGFNPLVDTVMKQVVSQPAPQKGNSTDSKMIKALLARLENQGIKSVTYRYPVEEIAEFDQMILDIQKGLGGKRVSKNDVQRTAVNFLLEDWQERGTNSLIFRVLKKQVESRRNAV